MSQSTPQLDDTWDCHLHIFDPEQFPYKPGRTYTPTAATLESLLSTSPAKNFLVVQASVEDGPTAVLSHLRRARREHPDRTFRAEADLDPDGEYDDQTLRDMQDAGVRALRLHGEIGVSVADRTDHIRSLFEKFAKIARRAGGWYISAMCPLDVWVQLGPWLTTCPELDGISVIIEHNGRPDPTRDLAQYPEFERFLQLVENNPGKLFVKLCGINRLDIITPSPDGRMEKLPACVVAIAERVPDSIIWGSDWPHVRYEAGNASGKPVPGKTVDLRHELDLLRSAVSRETWTKMMVATPKRLFE